MEYKNSVEFRVFGKYALFTDPLTRIGGEKFSYQVPTYQALKGILESVYWKPTLIWIIDSVRVMKIIQTQSKGIRPIKYSGGNDLSIYTYLADVEYQVRAHFEWNTNRPELEQDRNENKHFQMAERMIKRGGRRDIFLGTRECQGYVEPCVFGNEKGAYDGTGDIPYSLMLHGFTYADEAECEEDRGMMTVRFWQPVMKNGVIEFLPPKDCTIKRHIKEMSIKPFGQKYGNFSGLEESGLDLLGGDGLELDTGAL